MDAPNPDAGEEHPHTNTQLFGTVAPEGNRFVSAEQMQPPVISTIAKGFATFDHWFCEVPSQTFTNRFFYHAGTASGLVVNVPYENFPRQNDAETVFERLDQAGLSWRVYADPGMSFSITIDPKTATGQEARDYMSDRQARTWPGLV